MLCLDASICFAYIVFTISENKTLNTYTFNVIIVRRMGRPKGSKSAGIPQRALKECIDYVTAAYETVGNSVMAFSEMRDSMGLEKGADLAVSGALNKYGLAEKDPSGYWRITDLGKRVAQEDGVAMKEALERVPIFKDLSLKFWDQEVTPGAVEQHIRSKYKKGEYAIEIVRQFLEAKELIQQLKPKSLEAGTGGSPSSEMFIISRMVGQLFPPENKGKAMEVLNELIKLSETHKLNKFAGYLEGLKTGFETKKVDDETIFKDLQKASSRAVDIFETESELKPKKHVPKAKDEKGD